MRLLSFAGVVFMSLYHHFLLSPILISLSLLSLLLLSVFACFFVSWSIILLVVISTVYYAIANTKNDS